MKRFVVLCVALLISLFSRGAFAQEGLTKIADNVYSYVDVKNGSPANSFAANAGIIVGKDGIVVIDTLISAKEAQRFIKDIRRVSDKPIRYVVNTHYHLDHAFGNAEFARLGAVIVSHANDRKNLESNGEPTLKNAKNFGLTDEDMAGTTIALPTLTFTERMTMELGGERIELIYVAPSHTSGSILVHLPDKKLLFAGDILFTDFHPFMAEGDIAGWLKNLDYIAALDVERIIPGHGPLSGKKDIADMKSYLVAFDTKARELAAKSGDAAAIAAELKKSLPARAQGEWMIPYNLKAKYLKEKTD
ncbi:MAG: beta-lactamase domain-containing [Geobacteraceae bacterium]|nr:MAG: beta-lactamase domain-containing [Geobacteraceae bacterium]